MFNGMSIPLLGIVFAAAGAVVWVASTHLSASTDLLADRLHLGEALAGLLLLAVVEDLPEVVIVVFGSLSGHLSLVTGNLLGGIAAQTVLLVAVDAVGVADRPLTYRAASVQMVLVGLQGLVVFALAIMATQLPASLHRFRLEPGGVVIVLAWLATTWLLAKAAHGLPWRREDRDPLPPDVEKALRESKAADRRAGTVRTVAVFSVSALAILAGGYVLEESGNQLAGGVGLSGIVFGGTILAMATALPEFVTGYTAARRGDFELAVSEVFGSNTFLPTLFLLAALLSGQAVLAQAGKAEIFLTGLGMLLTTIYLWGLLFRPSRQYRRLGPDSIVVLLAYLIGIAGLIAVARS